MANTNWDNFRDGAMDYFNEVCDVAERMLNEKDGRIAKYSETCAELSDKVQDRDDTIEHQAKRISTLESEVAILQQSLARAERTVTL